MKPAAWRLLLAAVLFLGWIGYLMVLAIETTHPVVQFWPFHIAKSPALVLSRPQFLVARLVVVADVTQRGDGRPHDQVTVLEVPWPTDQAALANQQIQVRDLSSVTKDDGWQGSGRYILTLMPEGDHYQLVATPPSPGFAGRAERPRIYPDTPETREQLQRMPHPEKP